MPGVTINVAARAAPADPNNPPSGQWFVVGMAERGLTNQAVLLHGLADYTARYGGRVPYGVLYDQVKEFFSENGQQCWVVRVSGPNPTSGTLTVNDTSGQPTLKIDASSPGSWSSGLQVVVLAGLAPGTFRIQLILNGKLVDDFNNLSTPASAASRMSASPYVLVTDLGSTSTAPDNNPAPQAATALTAGDDDRTNVSTQNYIDALDLFQPEMGVGAVSIPGLGSAVHQAIADHCAANNRIGILAAEQDSSKTDLESLAAAVNSSYTGLFAPWVRVSDGAGGQYPISPEGYIAACRSTAHVTGPWIVPAGRISQSNAILDLEQTFTISDAEDLDTAGVSIIRKVGGTIRLYGYRSMSPDIQNYGFLTVQDLINYVWFHANLILEDYLFDPVDSSGNLLGEINADLVGLLDPIAVAGGLYGQVDDTGTEIDPGYSVDTSSNVNTPSTLANNKVVAVVTLRPSPTAAEITLEIVRVGFSTAITATTTTDGTTTNGG